MKIIKLKAENIKKLIAVEITPTGNVVKITGKNASGKTSILDSIYWALGGVQNVQDEPIRKGEKKATVEVDLGEMIVKRTFNQGDSGATTSLIIENKDGLRFKSPQTMLDGLLGKLSFDPLEFMRRKPTEQHEILRALTGVDTSKLEAIQQKAYDERTLVNRDVKRLEVKIEAVVVPEILPSEVDISELAERLNEAVGFQDGLAKANEQVQALTNEAARVENKMTIITQTIQQHEQTILNLKKEYRVWQDKSQQLSDNIDKAKECAQGIVVPDISAIQTELKEAEQNNRVSRQAWAKKQEKDKLVEELKVVRSRADELTAKIEAVEEEKHAMIAAAKFPLEGLRFGNGAVTYQDLPLNQASSAEQLRVSMAMAMSLNPKLKIIRITDGSLLDSSSMKIVEEMANGNDYQVWLEQVDESGKVGIVISEGAVVAVN